MKTSIKIQEKIIKIEKKMSLTGNTLVLKKNNSVLISQKINHNDLEANFRFIRSTVHELFEINTILEYYAECESNEDLKSKFSTFWFLKIFLTSIESPTDVEMYIIHQGVCLKLSEDLANFDFENKEYNQIIKEICSSKYMFDRTNLSSQIYNQDTKCFNWIDF